MPQADIIGAGRYQPPVHAMMAEVAFQSHVLFRIKADGSIGAGFQAGAAPRTTGLIKDNNAIGPLGNGLLRTGLRTRGGVTVPADHGPEDYIQHPIHFPGAVFLDG